MDSDEYTCGKCRHGNFYDDCNVCEELYEKQREDENGRLQTQEVKEQSLSKTILG
jgi:hypothetical protein